MIKLQLLEIISCALKGKKYQKKVIDEKEVLIQADENSLLPLFYVGIEKTCLSKDLALKNTKKNRNISQLNKL